MGTICDSCKNQRNNNNNEDSNSSKGSKNETLSETNLLPKQCVDEIISKKKAKNYRN